MIENAERRSLLGSISAALSCAVYVPPRKESKEGKEGGLLSRTVAGNRA